jgi:hypothetical protein
MLRRLEEVVRMTLLVVELEDPLRLQLNMLACAHQTVPQHNHILAHAIVLVLAPGHLRRRLMQAVPLETETEIETEIEIEIENVKDTKIEIEIHHILEDMNAIVTVTETATVTATATIVVVAVTTMPRPPPHQIHEQTRRETAIITEIAEITETKTQIGSAAAVHQRTLQQPQSHQLKRRK